MNIKGVNIQLKCMLSKNKTTKSKTCHSFHQQGKKAFLVHLYFRIEQRTNDTIMRLVAVDEWDGGWVGHFFTTQEFVQVSIDEFKVPTAMMEE